MKLDEMDIYGVAKYVANHPCFRGKNYEKFAEKVLELVKKYGVATTENGADYDLGAAIYKTDPECADYFTELGIGRLLYGNSELTEEQKRNRAIIKGEIYENI